MARMAEIQRHCQEHPQRRAIAVCVVTGKAICLECSTRYEGVNYSKEGLEQLQAERRREQARGGVLERVAGYVLLGASPLLLLALYGFVRLAGGLLIDMGQNN